MKESSTLNRTAIRHQQITGQSIISETFPVTGMSCASCAVSVESTLQSLPGVRHASVNFADQSTNISYDPSSTDPAIFKKSIQAIGYDLIIDPVNKDSLQEEESKKKHNAIRQQTIGAALFSVPIVLIGMFFMKLSYANWIMMILSTPVLFYFGQHFFINAWKQLLHRKANMDTLVALSTGSAWIFSVFNTIYPGYWIQQGLEVHVYFEAAAVVISFISLGKLMEERAKSKTSFAIRKLIGLQSKTVHIVRHGETLDIPVEKLKIGEIVLVKPGEKIPVDGTIKEGQSHIEESTITGEPLPVLKSEGSPVFAGTLNQKGSFQFVTEKLGSDTVLGQIIKMVQTAQGSKAPVQRLVDKVSGIFVPVVIGISLVTFIIWMATGGANAFSHGLLAAVTVLVIACPCALGLATPTAIMVAVGKGAESNILIRDAESLELARKVDTVVLDKTGTITEGKPGVTDIVFAENKTIDFYKRILISIEMKSEHPLADAMVSDLLMQNVQAFKIEKFESITGKGVMAFYENERYLVGNANLMTDFDIIENPVLASSVKLFQAQGKTVVYFAKNQDLLAVIAITDPVKKGSKAAIQHLQKQGLDVYMLTGDHESTAEIVAREVGITHFKAGVLPSEKELFVVDLKKAGKIVAMAGDGINDSQALAQADISIAMGKGSDIAMDVAQMTIIGSDLNNISRAFTLSKKTVYTIRQNLFWAFIYNVIGIPIAAGILYPFNGFLLSPMIAGAAMA
ncbi:MAG TPA: heavy metal translocating P-type ATPase, partial [Puia sp.]|nr:heavy metal translocating P-type ATPase [Puia sp.]